MFPLVDLGFELGCGVLLVGLIGLFVFLIEVVNGVLVGVVQMIGGGLGIPVRFLSGLVCSESELEEP